MALSNEARSDFVRIADARERRCLVRPEPELGTAQSLFIWLKAKLRAHSAPGCDVEKLVQMGPNKSGRRVITCGVRGGESFIREDRLGCEFTFTFDDFRYSLQVYSYAFEVQVPEDHPILPRFLRWEYEPVAREGVDRLREPLAHLHPGDQHIRLPSPVLTPKELVAQFLELPWSQP